MVILFLSLFAISAFFLFVKNEQELDPEYKKDWWVISFAEPNVSESLAFTVENHSQETQFHYQIRSGKTVLAEETFFVERGKRTVITPTLSASSDIRTKILVTHKEEQKEIYR